MNEMTSYWCCAIIRLKKLPFRKWSIYKKAKEMSHGSQASVSSNVRARNIQWTNWTLDRRLLTKRESSRRETCVIYISQRYQNSRIAKVCRICMPPSFIYCRSVYNVYFHLYVYMELGESAHVGVCCASRDSPRECRMIARGSRLAARRRSRFCCLLPLSVMCIMYCIYRYV